VKIADIVYIAIITLIVGYGLALFSNNLFGKFDKEEAKKELHQSKYMLIIRLITVVSYSFIILYIARNVLEIIPSPFNGICKFDHARMKEHSTIITLIFFLFFSYLFDFLSFVRDNYAN
jgi:Na+-driven multidrug efflux pump